jgi:hypothetical protein
MRRKALRIARIAALALVALEVVYLLAANLALWTGLVRRAVSAYPDSLLLTHGFAYTVIPGRVHVSDLALRMQDQNIQFQLTVAHARVDVHLPSLLRGTFHGDHVRCEGVSFRFVHRVHDKVGMEARLAAYPPIPGLARPALFQVPPPPPATQEEIDALWTVRLDDVAADVRELWFLEYRWEGKGRATGGFELSPKRHLQIGPVELALEGGTLHAGPHVVSKDLRLRVGTTVESVDVEALGGTNVFRPIAASVHLEAKDFSPALAALYVDGLTAAGAGSLAVDATLASGRFQEGTRVTLEMTSARAAVGGFVYEGAPRLAVALDAAGVDGLPTVHATVPGSVVVPVPPGKARVDLTRLVANGALSGRDLVEGISLERLDARLEEARVIDARAIRSAILGSTPLSFVSPVLLGDGPLVASAAVDLRKTVTVALLRYAGLGLAELRGAARTSGGGWDGAAAGHIGLLPVGVRLKDGKSSVALFVPDGWLDAELAVAGIRFEVPLVAR